MKGTVRQAELPSTAVLGLSKISYEVAVKVNLWLGVPETIRDIFFSDHDPQVENW